VEQGTTYALERSGTLRRFDTTPCVTIGGQSRAPKLLLYVLDPPSPERHAFSSMQSVSARTRWYERTDADGLEIDTSAGTVVINGQKFAMQGGNVFIKSAIGACGPRAAKVKETVSPTTEVKEVLERLQALLPNACEHLSLRETQ